MTFYRTPFAPHFFARKFRAESNIRVCGLHLQGAVQLPDQKDNQLLCQETMEADDGV